MKAENKSEVNFSQRMNNVKNLDINKISGNKVMNYIENSYIILRDGSTKEIINIITNNVLNIRQEDTSNLVLKAENKNVINLYNIMTAIKNNVSSIQVDFIKVIKIIGAINVNGMKDNIKDINNIKPYIVPNIKPKS